MVGICTIHTNHAVWPKLKNLMLEELTYKNELFIIICAKTKNIPQPFPIRNMHNCASSKPYSNLLIARQSISEKIWLKAIITDVYVYGSNVFDMLNVASDFGVLDDVVSIARLGHIWSKDMWKRKIWKRAWDMDECFWAIQAHCHRSLDLLANVCGGGGGGGDT